MDSRNDRMCTMGVGFCMVNKIEATAVGMSFWVV